MLHEYVCVCGRMCVCVGIMMMCNCRQVQFSGLSLSLLCKGGTKCAAEIPETAVLGGHSPLPPYTLCWLLLSVLACQTSGCSFSLLTHKVWERDGHKQRERRMESGVSVRSC